MPQRTVKTIIFKLVVDNKEAKKKTKETEKAIVSMSDVIRSRMKIAGKAFDIAKSALRKFGQGIDKTIKIVMNLGKLMVNVFQKIASNALTSFVVDAVKNFANFEDILGHARRTMNLTRKETLELGDSLIDLASNMEDTGLKSGVTANELGKISGILGQLGFNVKDNKSAFEAMVVTVAKVGVAFGMSNQRAAEGLGILRNLFNLPVQQMENIASSIAALGNSTVATAGQIINIMQRMGGIAGLLGVSAQEAAGFAATLRQAGISQQVAGTAMSQIFSRLSSDVDKFGEVLAAGGVDAGFLRMQIESGNATEALKSVLQGLSNIQSFEGKIAATQALKDLGLSGVRVQQALLGLSNNLGALNTNIALSNQAFVENEAVNDAYQAAIDNSSRFTKQFFNILDSIKKIVGKDLAIAFGDFLQKYLNPFMKRFQDWLQTSKGAKSILGPDGIIATGLQAIGNLLSDNEELLFTWLDELDTRVPAIIDDLKKKFSEWAGGAQEDFQVFKQDLKDVFEQIKNIITTVDTWIKKGQQFKQDWEDGIQIIADWIVEIEGANEALTLTEEGVEALTKASGDMGNKLLYQSVFPDLIVAIDKTTTRLYESGTAVQNLTGHSKELHKTGINTWTNIKREIVDTSTVWERSDIQSLARGEKIQGMFGTTINAVNMLGSAYKKTGEEVEAATFKMVDSLDLFKDAVRIQGAGLNAATQAQTGQSLQSIGNFNNLSSAALQQLLSKPGFLSSQGMIGISQIQQRKLREESGIPTIDTSMPLTQTQGLGNMTATINLGDEEIGVVTSKINDTNQQQSRRSFGSVGRTQGSAGAR